MKKTVIKISVWAIIFLFFPVISKACSAFMLKGENYCFVGFNENWKTMPGMVVMNKRDVHKQSLNWAQLTSDIPNNGKKASWVSKYGSVSFNLLGIDLPCYGINEKGLFIVELFLDKTFSVSDSTKPNMFWAQWIQYQLDNFSSVEEVIFNLKDSPIIDWWPTFPGSHFFISDKQGKTAAIELIEGKFHISYNENMPIPVLCNEEYQKEVENIKIYKTFGGKEDFNMSTWEWNDRFAKAAHNIKIFDLNKMSPFDFSWSLLANLIAGQWQMVYDIINNKVYFRSDIGKDIKYVDIAQCNFSDSLLPKFLDINSPLKGDVFADFEILTEKTNSTYVAKGFPIGYENEAFYSSPMYTALKRNLQDYFRITYKRK